MSNYTKTTNFASKDNLSPGNPLKIVKGTEIDTEFNNIATAVATKTDNASAAITGGSITGITDLAVADGGTGASTANAALNNLLPSQASASGKYLKSNGTDASWDQLDISTADITGTLPVANGGTGVTSSTGTGSVVLSNSPTLVTPALGTPSSGTATNLTGLPISTGVSGLGTGVATFLGTPSSANLASAITDETGSGALVFANSPTLVTPTLGTPASATLTNATGLPIGTGVSGLGTGVATALAVNVGSSGAPLVNGGVLGTPSSGTATNLTGLPISTGVSGLGTGVATALAVNVGSAGAPVVNGGALGTPSSGTATNLTGLPLSTGVTGTLPVANGGTGQTTATAAFNALAPSQATNSGKYLTTDGTNTSWATVTSGSGDVVGPSSSTDNALVRFDTTTGKLVQNSVGILSDTGAISGLTDISASGSVTLSGGTANGVTYLNGSKVLTSGSALTFDGTNLGVGVTPSAWATFTGLQVGALGGVNIGGAIGDNFYAMNAYYNAGWKYAATGYTALMYRMVNGEHRWSNAASGTAGNAITFTQAMTLDSSGNLMLGLTSGSGKFELASGSGSSVIALRIRSLSGNSNGFQIVTDSTTDNIYLNNYYSAAMMFGTNNTERARIDSSGNLLLGVTSSTGLTGTGDFAMPNNRAIRFRNAANSAYLNMIYVDTSNNLNFGYGGVPPTITFGINGVGEVSRFDSSGNFLVGKTSASTTTVGAELQPTASAGYIASFTSDAQRAVIANRLTSDGELYSMRRSGTVVGTISVTTTATAYNTSSDYRLKNTIAPMSGALAKVAQLKPVTYKWNADGSDGEGFIAHELADVVPQCVTGEKDAVDADGNPKYQGIDTSFLVATLTAALQELNAKFEAYVASHP